MCKGPDVGKEQVPVKEPNEDQDNGKRESM